MHGRYILTLPERKLVIPNVITDEGEAAMLAALFQGDETNWVAPGGNFYLGLCNQTPTDALSLGGLTTEPPGSGYARQPILRSAVGWPTLAEVNEEHRVRSASATFAAVGGAIGPVSRVFLCNVLSGTAGKLYSVSGPFSPAITISDGTSITVEYEAYLG